jgi:polysulfide reductase chain C
MLFGFIYCLFWLPPQWNLFYYSWTWLRDLSMWLMMIFGICVVLYTGVLLCTMKAKPFWNTPALPVLFTVSGVSTACALLSCCTGIWPAYDQVYAAITNVAGAATAGSYTPDTLYVGVQYISEQLHHLDMVLVAVEIMVLLVYVLCMRAAGNTTAKAVAKEWIQGSKAVIFWGGMMVCGLIVPFLFYLLGDIAAEIFAPVLILASGLLLRFLIVYSDRRREIPGEARYYSRLPRGDEKFLQPWKKVS